MFFKNHQKIIKYVLSIVFILLCFYVLFLSVKLSYYIFKLSSENNYGSLDSKYNIYTNGLIKNNFQTKSDEIEKYDISILAVGDVMVHTPQLAAQKNIDGTYSFNNNFTYVKPILSSADISIANLETTLAGASMPYDGYPRFNTPDALLDALIDSGVDVINFCNNHTLDTGKDGVLRTLDVMDEKNIPYIGIRKNVDDKRYVVIEKNNVKVAITGYTYQIPIGTTPTLNGNVIPNELVELINTFNYYNLDNDLNEMGKVIDDMHNEADIVVVVIHWGNEYETENNAYQETIAKFLAEKKVDVIFGSHPHVLQPFNTIEGLDNHSTLVFYSMGNFLSNQRYEAMQRSDTEDGIILKVNYEKIINHHYENEETIDAETINYISTDYIPTWVNKYYDNTIYKNVYEILPLNLIEINQEDKEKQETKTEGNEEDKKNELVSTFKVVINDDINQDITNETRAKKSYENTINNIITKSNIENLNELKINRNVEN